MAKKGKYSEIREWLNTAIALFGLIVLILGVIQVSEVNVNLKNITAEDISANKIDANQMSVKKIQNVSNITFKSGGKITG